MLACNGGVTLCITPLCNLLSREWHHRDVHAHKASCLWTSSKYNLSQSSCPSLEHSKGSIVRLRESLHVLERNKSEVLNTAIWIVIDINRSRNDTNARYWFSITTQLHDTVARHGLSGSRHSYLAHGRLTCNGEDLLVSARRRTAQVRLSMTKTREPAYLF